MDEMSSFAEADAADEETSQRAKSRNGGIHILPRMPTEVVVVGRVHSFTPSLLHFLLDIWNPPSCWTFGNPGGENSQYEKAWNARGKF